MKIKILLLFFFVPIYLFSQYRTSYPIFTREYPTTGTMFDPHVGKHDWAAFNITGKVKKITEQWTYGKVWGSIERKLEHKPREFRFNEFGNLTHEITDEKTNYFIYDSLNRKKEMQYLFRDKIMLRCVYKYNALGKLSTFTVYGTDKQYNPLLIYENKGVFDTNGNLIQEIICEYGDDYGNEYRKNITKNVLEHSYNSKNQRIHTKYFKYYMDLNSSFVPMDEGQKETIYKYNNLGNNTEIVDKTIIYGSVQTNKYIFDNFGHLIEESHFSDDRNHYHVLKEYDNNQNLIKFSSKEYDSEGNLYHNYYDKFTYDLHNNQISESNFQETKGVLVVKKLAKNKTYTYDNSSNWIKMVIENHSDKITTIHERIYIYY